MKLNCNIVDDLLPLYLEDICSEDSKAALEEHLQECFACGEKLARMRNSDIIPQTRKQERKFPMVDYAGKVKRHRMRIGLFVTFISVLAACLLSLCFLTVSDMRRQANPLIFDVEEGVCNLTAADFVTTTTEVDEYIFYTNSEQIRVSIQKDVDFDTEMILWNVTDKDNPYEIAHAHVGSVTNTCTFTNLSAHYRYMITCDEGEEMSITVSEGRVSEDGDVSFWNSLKNVLGTLF